MPNNDYFLTSERLGFRLIDEDDLEDLIKLDTDPNVRAHFPDGVLNAEQVEARISKIKDSYQNHSVGDYAVIDLASGQFAGRAGFGVMEDGEIEIGYVFLKDFWGRGLAGESAAALLGWARQNLDVPRIIAYAPADHFASFNVMKKAGMHFFKSAFIDGRDYDFYEFPL